MDADESEAYQHLEHDLGFSLSPITARTRPDSGRYIHCKLLRFRLLQRDEEVKTGEKCVLFLRSLRGIVVSYSGQYRSVEGS